MRNPARIPIVLDAIRKVWERSPDLRLCQLIYCVTARLDQFMLEDDAFIKELNEWANKYVVQST